MLRYVCDVCGVTADRDLPPSWAVVQITIPPPPVIAPAIVDNSVPPVIVGPTLRTDHICDLHREGAVSLNMETKR